MTAQDVNPRLVRCTVCDKDLPLSEFHPSMIAPTTKQTQCRPCLAGLAMERNRRKRLGIYQRLRAAFGDRVWTSVEAADVAQANRTGMGAMLEALRRDGLVRRLDVGRYVFSDVETPPEPAQLELAPPPTSTPGRSMPAASAQIEPQFLEVGTHAFSPPFTVIQDDRGRAAVVLPVAETDSRTGHTTPMTINFTAEEWAARRIISMSDLARGGHVDLFERVAELERTNEHLRRENSAAMALAEEQAKRADEATKKLAALRAAALAAA